MRPRRALTMAVAIFGLWQLASGFYIPAKAVLAQWLIHRAWSDTESAGTAIKPWYWADTAPIARLIVPAHDKDFIVLAGVSGEALSFGPGHVSASAWPGSAGHTMIGGHRDTHFRFLTDVKPGERMQLESADGRLHEYAVTTTRVVDSSKEPLRLRPDRALLTLITCYPPDALRPGGSLRYVVTAQRI